MDKKNPRVVVVEKNGKLGPQNRFTADRAVVQYGIPLFTLLDEVNCVILDHTGNTCITEKTFPLRSWEKLTQAFEIVQFKNWGNLETDILRQFEEAGLRAATIEELLAFAKHYIIPYDLIALGSSNSIALQEILDKRSLFRKLQSWMRKERFMPTKPVFVPSREGQPYLRLSEGAGGWMPEILFLAVHVIPRSDERLVDRRITYDEYFNIPSFNSFTKEELSVTLPFGTLIRGSGGEILEVSGGDMLIGNQYPNLSPPERAYNRYRPVFVKEVKA